MNEEQKLAKDAVERFLDEAMKNGAASAIAGVSYHKDGHDYWWAAYRGPCLSAIGLTSDLQCTLSQSMRITVRTSGKP